MPLVVKKDERHEWAFHDARTGADVVLYYRNPTMQEHVAWRSGAWGETEKPVAERLFYSGLESGKAILTGYRPGDIEFPDAEADNPANWIELLADARPEIIADFANSIFGAIQTGGPGTDVPFEKNSSG
jgi:hypothetical protein